MQVITASPVPLLLVLIFFPYTVRGQTFDSKPEVHPPWVYDERLLFQLLGVQSLDVFGGIPADKANWQLWKKNINQLPFSQNIKKVFFNSHFVTADEIEYFCGFENVEILYLGSSIEGVTILPDSLKVLPRLTKLQELNISIHGLSDRHLDVLEFLPNLRFLQIEFPSKNMLNDPDQFSDWRPAELSDSSLERISKLKNLEVFSFHPPGPDDGRVTFSSQGLLSLLEAPKLERLQIHWVRR